MDTSAFYPDDYRSFNQVDPAQLQVNAPKPPRYLIRVHSAYSRGLMTENSFVSAAEHLATQTSATVPTVHDYDPALFEHHVFNHLTNYKGEGSRPFQSPFVSLTVSLRLALAWAKLRSLWGHKDVRIAVLDTTTIMESNCDCGYSCKDPFHQNLVWPANMLYKACLGFKKTYPDEFLAFGHVRGVFKTCTFADLETSFFSRYLPELSRLPRDQRYEELPATLALL